MKSRLWERYLSDMDKAAFEAAGYGGSIGVGKRPALLVIDVQYSFTGDEPQPLLESIRKYRTACGKPAWDAMESIRSLLKVFRKKSFPVIYTISERRGDFFDSGVQRSKNFRHQEQSSVIGTKGTQVPEMIEPQENEIVISKRKPSAFFGTPLMSYLNQLDVDTLVVTGGTTSGCIRASVLDAFSYNFQTLVVEDATFDRFEFSHAANLFDLNTKYADVVGVEEALGYLSGLPERTKG